MHSVGLLSRQVNFPLFFHLRILFSTLLITYPRHINIFKLDTQLSKVELYNCSIRTPTFINGALQRRLIVVFYFQILIHFFSHI